MKNHRVELTEVPCPTCQKAVIWSAQSPYRPFCSKRCQLIDLGQWADEENALPGEPIVPVMEIGE